MIDKDISCGSFLHVVNKTTRMGYSETANGSEEFQNWFSCVYWLSCVTCCVSTTKKADILYLISLNILLQL